VLLKYIFYIILDGEQAKRQRVDEEVAKKEDEVPTAETASS